MSNASKLIAELQAKADPAKATFLQRFFKNGVGEYAEGDRFLGLTVPQTRTIIRGYLDLSLLEIQKVLRSPLHECRLAALLILVHQFSKGAKQERAAILRLYLANTKWINNWDLVDSSAPMIISGSVTSASSPILRRLARSKNMWENRIAVVGTHGCIRRGDTATAMAMCEQLLHHPHDLMHKAVGWTLREVGKRDEAALHVFLLPHAATMPRTALRYAIERMAPQKRRLYMRARKRSLRVR